MRQRLVALPGGSETASSSSSSRTPHTRKTPRELVPVHIVSRWDSDARAAAWEQAQDANARDPDAAQYLLDCLATDTTATSETDEPADEDDSDDDVTSRVTFARSHATPAKPFDPMRLLARAARYYRWSHHDMMHMPWRTFLGYVREADIMTQEEKAAYDDEMRRGRGRAGGRSGDADALRELSNLPRVGP